MKILVANIPLPQNRFLVDLHGAMEKDGIEIDHCHETFWSMQGDYDVVHLHFPEYMTYEVEKAYNERKLSDGFILEIEKRLKSWSEKSRIVITRHVLLPHHARKDPQWEYLYELCYSYADAVVHFATASIKEFQERYSKTNFQRGIPPQHMVIPHANYASLPNDITREEARSQFGIPDNAKVMLVFGAIRNFEERDLIATAFKGTKAPNKLLLVSRWREKLANVPSHRLKILLRDLKRAYYKFHPKYVFNYSFVEEEDAQLYLNASDVLFIPRFKVLNSGNVTLGMTFGKIVVGPDSWDVGELLRETGNVTFDPQNPSTAAAAVDKALELADTDVGEKNRQLALSEWSPEQCASRYREVYNLVQKPIQA